MRNTVFAVTCASTLLLLLVILFKVLAMLSIASSLPNIALCYFLPQCLGTLGLIVLSCVLYCKSKTKSHDVCIVISNEQSGLEQKSNSVQLQQSDLQSELNNQEKDHIKKQHISDAHNSQGSKLHEVENNTIEIKEPDRRSNDENQSSLKWLPISNEQSDLDQKLNLVKSQQSDLESELNNQEAVNTQQHRRDDHNSSNIKLHEGGHNAIVETKELDQRSNDENQLGQESIPLIKPYTISGGEKYKQSNDAVLNTDTSHEQLGNLNSALTNQFHANYLVLNTPFGFTEDTVDRSIVQLVIHSACYEIDLVAFLQTLFDYSDISPSQWIKTIDSVYKQYKSIVPEYTTFACHKSGFAVILKWFLYLGKSGINDSKSLFEHFQSITADSLSHISKFRGFSTEEQKEISFIVNLAKDLFAATQDAVECEDESVKFPHDKWRALLSSAYGVTYIKDRGFMPSIYQREFILGGDNTQHSLISYIGFSLCVQYFKGDTAADLNTRRIERIKEMLLKLNETGHSHLIVTIINSNDRVHNENVTLIQAALKVIKNDDSLAKSFQLSIIFEDRKSAAVSIDDNIINMPQILPPSRQLLFRLQEHVTQNLASTFQEYQYNTTQSFFNGMVNFDNCKTLKVTKMAIMVDPIIPETGQFFKWWNSQLLEVMRQLLNNKVKLVELLPMCKSVD